MSKPDYRERLYNAYVRSGQAEAVSSAADLEKRAPYLRQVISRHFPADRKSRIVDLGCGPGALLHFAQLAGYRTLRGIDASPEQVACARRLGLDCVERGDALAELRGLPAHGVDVIVAFDLLEHMTKDEVMEFLDAAYAALAPGGRMILHLPNGESPFGGAVLYGDFTHQLAFTRRSIAQVAQEAGFASTAVFEESPVPHGLKSLARRALWSALRTMLQLVNAIETGDGGAIVSRNMLVVVTK